MKNLLLALCTATLASTTQAAAVFSDNFDAAPLGTNTIPPGWNVTNGSVDTIGTGFFDLLPGNGRYLDLDGSTNDGGTLVRGLSLTAGTQYVANFDLAGSQRGDTNLVQVTFGTRQNDSIFTLASGDGFATFSMFFTPTATGNYILAFENFGGDNFGALLDRVVVQSVVTAVPEPETYAMMLAGLGLLGYAGRRKQRKSA